MKITLNEQDIYKLIKESIRKILNEGIEWSKNDDNSINFTVNHNNDDYSNTNGSMSVDTRVFGDKNDILYGDKTGRKNTKNLAQKYIEKSNTIKCYKSVIDYINNGRPGKPFDYIYTDNVPSQTITGIEKWFENNMSDERILDYCKKAIVRFENEFNPINHTYNRVVNTQNKSKIARYITGVVPDTNVKYIALFSMKDFNFSDAIKHGFLRPNSNTDDILGINKSERPESIPITYDGHITPNIAQNFSLQNVQDGHFKQQYQYQGGKYNTSELTATDLQRELSKTKTYSSVSKFIDKSVMYAAYALKEENFIPTFIVAAPSSSKFNHYYCTNLSRKIGAEYIPDFFKRNAINVVFQNNEEEIMRQKGIPQTEIDEFKEDVSNIAFKEINYMISQPLEIFLNKYSNYFSNISKEKHGREKIDFNTVKKIIMRYASITLKNSTDEHNFVAKYIISRFQRQNRFYDEKSFNTKLLLNNFFNIIKLKGLIKEFNQVINEMVNISTQYAEILATKGYKLNTKRTKITNFKKHLREYIHNLYVIADEHLTNGNLQKRYSNAKFLIFDEDINSGATLKLTIDTLENKLPDSNTNNILCLVNGYSASGF